MGFVRRYRRWILLTCGLALLAWFAPSLVVLTPARHLIASWMLPGFRGQIEIGRASLGWLSPVTLKDVKLTDENDEPLLELSSVRIDRVLLALMTHPSKPGQITIHSATAHLMLVDDSSNWEEAFKELLSQPESDSQLEDLSIRIEDSQLEIQQANDSEMHRLAIDVVEWTVAKQGAPMTAQATIRNLSNDGSIDTDEGRLELQFNESNANDQQSSGYSILCKCDQFQVTPLEMLIRRFVGDLDVSGTVTGGGNVELTENFEQIQIDLDELAIEHFQFHHPALNSDRLNMVRATADGSIAISTSSVSAESLEIQSDFGSLSASGSIDLKEVQSAFSNRTVEINELDDFSLSGSIDIAQFANQLRETMKVREDLELRSGDISFVAFSRMEGRRRRLFLDVQASSLDASQGVNNVRWDQPIHASVSVRSDDSGVDLEFIEIDSDFISARGDGDFQQGQLTGSINLDRLHEHASQFMQLDDWQIAGEAEFSAEWEQFAATSSNRPSLSMLSQSTDVTDSNQQTQADVDRSTMITSSVNLMDLSIDVPGMETISERQLNVQTSFEFRFTPDTNLLISSGNCRVDAQSDSLVIESMAPFVFGQSDPIPIGLTINGQIDSIASHFRQFLPEPVLTMSGLIQLTGTGYVSPQSLTIDGAPYSIDNFRAPLGDNNIAEPRVEGQLFMNLDWGVSRIDLTQTTIVGSAMSLVANQFEQSWNENDKGLEAELAFRTDAFRAGDWFSSVRSMPYRVFGEATGTGEITITDSSIEITIDAQCIPLAIGEKKIDQSTGAESWVAVFQDDETSFDARLDWDSNRNQINLAQFDFRTPTVGVDATGYVSDLSSDWSYRIEGNLTTDLNRLSDQFSASLGDLVRFEGISTKPFVIRGSTGTTNPDMVVSAAQPPETGLVPLNMYGEASLSFDRALLLGIETGPGVISGNLSNQVIRFDELAVPVDDGLLMASPTIRLSGSTPVLEFRNDQLFQSIRLSPQVTRNWIAYAAPIIAGATEAEGTFSLNIEQASIPLPDAFTGSAIGTLTIDQATLGPGPLGGQLIRLAQQLRSLLRADVASGEPNRNWAQLPPQVITFQLHEGRVYHDRVIIQIVDLIMASSGSIGGDQSLDPTVNVQFPEDWFADRRIAGLLSGASFNVPVGGTLDRPALDQRALRQLSTDLLRNAAGGVLENELQRALQQIFK